VSEKSIAITDFTRMTGIIVASCVALLLIDKLPDLMENSPAFRGALAKSDLLRRLERVPGELHNGELNAEDLDALAANYYEGLRRDAAPIGLPEERDDMRFRDDFLLYEFSPNVKRSYSAGMRITNSLGMPNPEYGYQKPPHTRRIALLGDSISLGPYGHSYEQLLEGYLNQAASADGTERFEVLNFAVNGYSIVQTMASAQEKVPMFDCDVYLVEVSFLELLGRAGWRTHIGRLVINGNDLKYDFLRGIVAQAGVQRTDHLPEIRTKLAPFFRPVTQWALEQIKAAADSHGARMVVILVPPPVDTNLTATRFNELRPIVDSLGVPVIDLRDTFIGAKLDDLQVLPESDIHPNVRGHEMIFENLSAKLRAQPDAWAALTGNGAPPATDSHP
jgi:hypothetical protein